MLQQLGASDVEGAGALAALTCVMCYYYMRRKWDDMEDGAHLVFTSRQHPSLEHVLFKFKQQNAQRGMEGAKGDVSPSV